MGPDGWGQVRVYGRAGGGEVEGGGGSGGVAFEAVRLRSMARTISMELAAARHMVAREMCGGTAGRGWGLGSMRLLFTGVWEKLSCVREAQRIIQERAVGSVLGEKTDGC